MRHVVVMSSTGAIGLIAIFLVDLINLFYISMLSQNAVAAAVGFAGAVSFFQTSFCIGIVVAIAAVVSRAVGSGNIEEAHRKGTASMIVMTSACALVALGTYLFLGEIVDLLGAEGETRAQAYRYLQITQISLPLQGIAMGSAALLRSAGHAKRSMNVALLGAAVTAVLDPILIFGLGLNLEGAAVTAVLARLTMALVGLNGAHRVHQLLGRFDSRHFAADTRAIAKVAGPSILANMATPFGTAFVTHFMAQFGPAAVAGHATIERLTPVAFGLVYALSSAVGPIFGQNLGAKRIDRVRQTLRDSLRFMVLAVCVAWLALALGQRVILWAFAAEGVTADLISLFCSLLAGNFLFIGALFVSNAAFNNLGYPLYSMGFNWARATLGTIPFAYLGSHHGAAGVLTGPAIGAVFIGTMAAWVAFRITRRLAVNSLPEHGLQ